MITTYAFIGGNLDTVRVVTNLDVPEKIKGGDMFRECLSHKLKDFNWFNGVESYKENFSRGIVVVNVDYKNLFLGRTSSRDDEKDRKIVNEIIPIIKENIHKCIVNCLVNFD
jgi:hypothetical protein